MKTIKPAILVVAILAAVGCQHQYVRDTNDPPLDEAATSLRLDRKDLDRLYQENANVRRALQGKEERNGDQAEQEHEYLKRHAHPGKVPEPVAGRPQDQSVDR
jgi:hypothetical protein